MKKTLIWLLCACMLLSGCAGNPSTPTETNPPAVTSPSTEPTQPGVPLLDQGIGVGENGNLLYIPNDAVEDMPCPEVWLFGNGLLLGAHIRGQFVLRHIRLEDGRLLAECAIAASPGVRVRIGNGCIGLLDSGTNRFLLLGEDLTLRSSQTFQTEGDSWYLNPELDKLYRFYSDKGLQVRDLQTGEERWIVENAVFTSVIGEETEYILFEYTDSEDQRTYTRCLNLSTGAMETIPCSGPISTGTRRGETWLLREDGVNASYILSDRDSVASFTWTYSAASLLSPRKHLLLLDQSGRNLRLYDTQGRFVSTCTLPDAEYGTAGTDLVWSGYWGGYFFTDTIGDTCRLMFWDIATETQGEDLTLIPVEEPQKIQPIMEQAFYERAEALSERFGVKILIAEQCAAEYSSYNTYPMTAPDFVGEALDVLEECMGRYPEGFFRQLPHGTFEHIQIELVGALMLKEGVENQPDGIAAFVQEQDGFIRIVFDGYMLEHDAVYHEFSHVIDRRLDWDAQIRDDALFSEASWLALQPEGFAYAMSYTDMQEQTLRYANTGYFVSDYSMTYPTEDRATLIAAAITQSPLLDGNSAMLEKLEYYARCIRDCFDTQDWPEVVAWEIPLQSITNRGT
ncbi:MAG: hypothetical protein IKB09_04260 [Oscillospiraceae bacterium]|nr:hypothetical protein [Oscillospiraceae bacterium]